MSATVDRDEDAPHKLEEADSSSAEAGVGGPDTTSGQDQPWYPDGPPRLAGGGDDVDRPGSDEPGDDGGSIRPWWQRPINLIALLLTTAVCFAMIGWSVGSERQQRHNAVDTGFLQDMRTHHEQAVYMSLLYLARPDTDRQIQTVAVSIMQGQSIEIGRMIQLLRLFGEAEAANLDEPPMTWMGMNATADGGDASGTSDGESSPTEGSDMSDMTHSGGAMTDSASTDGETPYMPGMATESELETLQTLDGRAADELFVRLMIAHHVGGIDMADYEVAHGQNAQVRSMAESMSHGQRAEIAELTSLINTGA